VIGGGLIVATNENLPGNFTEITEDRGLGFPPQKPGGIGDLIIDDLVERFQPLGLRRHNSDGTALAVTLSVHILNPAP
jgi:hypothetical protein